MTRVEIDTNQETRCCLNCGIFCNNEQLLLTEKVLFNGKDFYVTRVEPCDSILEDSREIGAGNPACKTSLQESVNGKRN